MLVLERERRWRPLSAISSPDGSKVGDRVGEVLGVPQVKRFHCKAERAELVFSTLSVALAPLAVLAAVGR